MKRTQGRWRVTGGERAIESEGILVANSIGNSDTQKGNAYLIAAAPDLLGVAKLFEQWDTRGDEDGIRLRDVRKSCVAAIAKATTAKGG